MKTILLSIKPEYANKIMNGEKIYEFRRQIANCEVKRIIVYSTSPVKKVIGEVEVEGVIAMSKSALWEKTKQQAGISRQNFRKYFENSKVAYAYILKNPIKYSPPKELKDLGIKQAPQSFMYVS